MALLGPFQTITDVGWGQDAWEVLRFDGFRSLNPKFINTKLRVRLEFEDSTACGGLNDDRQFVDVRYNFKSVNGGTLRVNYINGGTGASVPERGFQYVFRMFFYFPFPSPVINLLPDIASSSDAFFFAGQFFEPGCGLLVPQMLLGDFLPATYNLQPGDNVVQMQFDTNLGTHHRGAFYDVSFSVTENEPDET